MEMKNFSCMLLTLSVFLSAIPPLISFYRFLYYQSDIGRVCEKCFPVGFRTGHPDNRTIVLESETIRQYRLGTCMYELSKVGKGHYFIGGIEFNSIPVLSNSHVGSGGDYNSFNILTDKNAVWWSHYTDWMIEILDDTHDYFENNDILYTTIGGDLIGLCRSNQPLFWDDDLDLMTSHEGWLFLSDLILSASTKTYGGENNTRVYKDAEHIEINGRVYLLSGVCRFGHNCSEIRQMSIRPALTGWFERMEEIGDLDTFFSWREEMRYRKCPWIDFFQCDKIRCREQDEFGNFVISRDYFENSNLPFNEFQNLRKRERYFHDRLQCDDEGYICAAVHNRVGEKNYLKDGMKWFVYGHGPYPEHTKEDFPIIDFCGRRVRVPKIFLTDRQKACEAWVSKMSYGPEALLRVRQMVHRGVGRTWEELQDIPEWQFLEYEGHDEVFIPVGMARVKKDRDGQGWTEELKVLEKKRLKCIGDERMKKKESGVKEMNETMMICTIVQTKEELKNQMFNFSMKLNETFLTYHFIPIVSSKKTVKSAVYGFLSISEDNSCDFVISLEGDLMQVINFHLLSEFLIFHRSHDNLWAGRIANNVEVDILDSHSFVYDFGYHVYTGRTMYLPFQVGMFQILHKSLFECFRNDLLYRLSFEEDENKNQDNPKFMNLRMEDAAFGIQGKCCDAKLMDISHMFFTSNGVMKRDYGRNSGMMLMMKDFHEMNDPKEEANHEEQEQEQEETRYDDDDDDSEMMTCQKNEEDYVFKVCVIGSIDQSYKFSNFSIISEDSGQPRFLYDYVAYYDLPSLSVISGSKKDGMINDDGIFGYYDEIVNRFTNLAVNEDHSYESIEEQRQRQHCDYFMFVNEDSSVINFPLLSGLLTEFTKKSDQLNRELELLMKSAGFMIFTEELIDCLKEKDVRVFFDVFSVGEDEGYAMYRLLSDILDECIDEMDGEVEVLDLKEFVLDYQALMDLNDVWPRDKEEEEEIEKRRMYLLMREDILVVRYLPDRIDVPLYHLFEEIRDDE